MWKDWNGALLWNKVILRMILIQTTPVHSVAYVLNWNQAIWKHLCLQFNKKIYIPSFMKQAFLLKCRFLHFWTSYKIIKIFSKVLFQKNETESWLICSTFHMTRLNTGLFRNSILKQKLSFLEKLYTKIITRANSWIFYELNF